jgi:hypothetical protein
MTTNVFQTNAADACDVLREHHAYPNARSVEGCRISPALLDPRFHLVRVKQPHHYSRTRNTHRLLHENLTECSFYTQPNA